MRIRQAVFVDHELEPTTGVIREALGLDAPYADPGVAVFGLRNAVLTLGDQFIEVVAPARADTAAGRHLERRGPGGYMLILQVPDLAAHRRRAADLDIRTVWEIDEKDISATHLHPADVGGTILSLDDPRPSSSWRWAGPAWTGGPGHGPSGSILGVTIEVPDPDEVAGRWARLLGLHPRSSLALDDGQEIRFTRGDRGLCEVRISIDAEPGRAPERLEIGAASIVSVGPR